ncbi:MAG TPA: response regulator, partial [Planctomycetaceae bacterium]|nr:response regulator [Planctomycetaceae bacterium]
AAGAAWCYDVHSRQLHWWNEHFDLLHLPRTDFVGIEDWARAIHPGDRQQFERMFERLLYHPDDFECEYRLAFEPRWFVTRGHLLAGSPGVLVGITLDVTDARNKEEALRGLNRALGDRTQQLEATMQRLQRMTAELAQTEQRERQSLAHLLHDHLQQLLVAARYKTSAEISDKHEDWLREALGVVDGLLEEAIQASRTLTVELSPPVLNDANLEQSLQWLARWMEEKHHLRVELRISPMPGQSDQHKWLLFQLARELLFNVAKHSGVNEAVLTIGEQEREWRLVVEDEGQGFESDPVEFTSSGFGLFSMRQRLSAYGGRVFVHSRPGDGCRVEIRVPTDPASPQKTSTWEKGESMPQPANGKHRRIRVLLADDHDILRSSLASLLRSESDIEVVGEACDGVAALEMADALVPDVVLMDITMPRLNGIEATRRIVHDHPTTRVVALSMHAPADLSESMRDAGAIKYVSKSAPISDLLNAIRVPAG